MAKKPAKKSRRKLAKGKKLPSVKSLTLKHITFG